VDENISDEDLKSAYKKLAIKYHPDKYKDDPEKFKQINQAMDLVKDYRENPHKYQQQNMGSNFGGWGNVNFGGINLGDLFNNHNQNRSNNRERISPPTIRLDLSFKESVIGCEKEIQYDVLRKCEPCNGNGFSKEHNGCKSCNGFGETIQQQHNFMVKSTCSKCQGRNIKHNKCKLCNNGAINHHIKGNISVPAGVQNGNILSIRGNGHFISATHFGDQYGDVLVHMNVKSENNMILENNDVISEINISLLEALKGKSIDIDTVYDSKTIEIKPLSKNKDVISIPNYGVKNTSGVHKIIINVDYPKNIDALISALGEENGISNKLHE
jgi:molecular chaperone DnaJ